MWGLRVRVVLVLVGVVVRLSTIVQYMGKNGRFDGVNEYDTPFKILKNSFGYITPM